MKRKCECRSNVTGGMPDSWYDADELPYRYHSPNECRNPRVKLWERAGKKIWLCSCCCLSTDKLVEDKK